MRHRTRSQNETRVPNLYTSLLCTNLLCTNLLCTNLLCNGPPSRFSPVQ